MKMHDFDLTLFNKEEEKGVVSGERKELVLDPGYSLLGAA